MTRDKSDKSLPTLFFKQQAFFLFSPQSLVGILKPRVGHRIRVRVRVRLWVVLRAGIFFHFCLLFLLLCFSPPEKKRKKTFCAPRKTVKEWFISIRYISESYLDALCHEVSWNAEGGSKWKIGHFHGSCFTPKVTRFRIDFVIVFFDGLDWQLYSRMDKKRTYADVVSGVLSYFFGDLEMCLWMVTGLF